MAEAACTEFFVDKHREKLIQSVTNITPLLEGLIKYDVIDKKTFDEIMSVPNSEGKMKALFSGPLQSSGDRGKKIFYNILETYEPHVLSDLKRERHENIEPEVSVEMMVSDIKLLLQTLAHFSDRELRIFNQVLKSEIHHRGRHSDPSWTLLMKTDLRDIVFLIVQTAGKQSVEMTKRVLKKMNRTDLVQKLSDRSSGTEKKHPVDEHLSALVHKVATMAAVKGVILETLSGLSYEDLQRFKWFLKLTCFHKGFPYISWRRLEGADLVEAMVEMCGLQSVDVTRQVLMDMNRTDVDQRLSEISSGLKASGSSAEVSGVKTTEGEKDEHCSALIQKEETMVSVIKLLLKELSGLGAEELNYFRQLLQRHQRLHSDVPWTLFMKTNLEDTVFLTVQTYGEESVKMTKMILKKMKRADLVQRLLTTKKLSVDEGCSALIQKVATVAAVKHLLLENLNDLSVKELQRFKEVLQLIPSPWGTSVSSWRLRSSNNSADLVDVIMETHSRLSVEVAKKVFININRMDLVQRLSETSSGPEDKLSGDEHHTGLSERVAAKDAVKHVLLETLKSLTLEDFNKFKWLLQFTYFQRGLPQIPQSQLVKTDRAEMVDLMVERFGQQSVEVIREVLTDMSRTDLLQSVSESSLQLRDKRHVDEERPALMKRVETMVSDIELLLQTLADLHDRELRDFSHKLKSEIHHRGRHSDPSWALFWMTDQGDIGFHRPLSDDPWTLLVRTDLEDAVFLMVQTFGEESVDMTEKILEKMNRTDLVKRLFDRSSRTTKKHPVDEHLSALVHKVATMAAVKGVILETLSGLSYEDLQRFKWFLQLTCFHKGFPYISWRRLEGADLVEAMVEMCGLQSVDVTRQVLMDMNRTDVDQRLSEISSGLKASGSSAEVSGVKTTEGEKDECRSALIQKEETMVSVIKLLLETLSDLSVEELNGFNHLLLSKDYFHRPHSDITWTLLMKTNLEDTVFLMVQTYGEESVEMTKMILKKMKRADLVQRLFDTSPGTTKKLSVDERCSALIQKVATVAAVKHLLLENLNDLSVKELQRFKEVLQLIPSPWGTSVSSWRLRSSDNSADLVDVIMRTYSRLSVEVAKKVFMDMNRMDLVQRLSETSSGLKDKLSGDEYHTGLSERVAAKDAVKHVLLETLKSLTPEDFNKFKWLLQFTYFQRGLPQIPQSQLVKTDRAEMVDLMVERFGQQSVEVIREVLTDMSRTDLLQSVSESSLQLREKQLTSLLQKDLNMTSAKEKLLATLEDLDYEEFKEFKWLLQQSDATIDLLIKHKHPTTLAQRVDVVELMVQTYGEQSVEVTWEILKKMNRSDLELRLSESSSGSKGDSMSLEVEGCGSTMQESSDWTKLDPEVNSTEADEASTYSLQSEAGHYECSVSALRWVCKERVSLKYQFKSWEDHMERMKSRQYMPAGPLMDITVNAGRLDEVHLPHWICIDDDPTVTDNFAVLHIDECGDVVEKVSEVTLSHVKLFEPDFSPRAVLVKVGLPVKIDCYVLIYYKPNTQFLKLHVYVIPKDPALQKEVEKKEISNQYKSIIKPHPDKYLRMKQGFSLTADTETAQILPKKLTLRYDSQDPNFYEVFIENPERNVNLTLSYSSTNKGESVWTCEIRKDDYPSSGKFDAAESAAGACCGAAQQVEEHLPELIQKATISSQSKLRERLLNTLVRLKQEDFKKFKWYLEDSYIPRCQLENSDMLGVVDLIVQTHSQQSVEVTKSIYKKINRNDLVEMLSGSSS